MSGRIPVLEPHFAGPTRRTASDRIVDTATMAAVAVATAPVVFLLLILT